MAKSNQPLSREDILAMLREYAEEAEAAHLRKIDAVGEARYAGLKWEEICAAAGISRVTAIRYAKISAGEAAA